MTNGSPRSPKFFPSDAVHHECHLPRVRLPTGLVCTRSVGPYILCMNNILCSIICALVKDNAFLVTGSRICKILKIRKVHSSYIPFSDIKATTIEHNYKCNLQNCTTTSSNEQIINGMKKTGSVMAFNTCAINTSIVISVLLFQQSLRKHVNLFHN